MKKLIQSANFILLFALPLIFCPGLEESFILPKRLLLYLGVALLLLGTLIASKVDLSIAVGERKNLYNILLFTLTILFLLAYLFSGSYSAGYNDILDWIPLLLLGFLWQYHLDGSSSQKGAFWLIAAGTLSAIYAFCQRLGIDPIHWQQADLVRTRSIGTLGNPDFLAGFLAIVLPLSLGALFSAKNPKSRWLFVLSTIFIVSGCLLSYSRGGWLALLSGGIVFFILSSAKIPKKQLVILFLIVVALFFLIKVGDRHKEFSIISRVKNFASLQDPSVSARFHLWKTALSLSLQHPLLGNGPGAFTYLALPYRKNEPMFLRTRLAMPERVHNDFLEIMVAFGIPALLVYLSLLVLSLFNLFRNARSSTEQSIFWAGMFSALIAFMVQGLFVYSTLPSLVILCFLIGSGNYRNAEKNYPIFAFTALFMVLLGMSLCLFNITADRLYFCSVTEQLAGNNKQAVNNIERAIKIFPFQPLYFIHKGKYLEAELVKNYSPELFTRTANAYIIAQKLNPLNPYPYADLGRLSGAMAGRNPGLGEIAIYAYSQALQRDPYNAFFLNDLANVYLDTNHPEQAITYYRKSLEIYPNSAITMGNLSRAYVLTGQTALAIKILTQITETDPKAKDAKQLLQYLKHGGTNK